MTRAEYKQNLINDLSAMSFEELKAYARAHGVKLYSRVPANMVKSIAQILTEREYHGDVFRQNPMNARTEIGD